MPKSRNKTDVESPTKNVVGNRRSNQVYDEPANAAPNELEIHRNASGHQTPSHKRRSFRQALRILTRFRKKHQLGLRDLFCNMPIAIVYLKTLFDDTGCPRDYIIEEVTAAYEKLVRMKRSDVVGKRAGDVFPSTPLSGFEWIETLRKVTLTGETAEFEQYIENAGRWFSISAYRSEGDRLTAIFSDITNYKSARETIREQNDFLERVKESLTHPFYVINAGDYRVTMANDASGFGVLEEDSYCFALTHGKDRPCGGDNHPCPLQEVKTKKKPLAVSHVHYDAAGKPRFVEIHAYPIFDRSGDVTKIIEYALDITERHRAESALIESEKRYRTLVQSINDTIFVIDTENRFSQFYSSSIKLLSSPPEDFLGRSIAEALPLDVAQLYMKLSNLVRATGNRQELEYSLCVGKSQIWFLASMDLHEDGESIVSVVKDITKRKHTEDMLRKSEERLAEAQRIAQLGNWDWDIITDRLHLSDEVHNIIGISPESFSGTFDAFLQLVHPNDRNYVRLSVTKAVNEMDTQGFEHRIVRPDGVERIVHEQFEVRRNDSGSAFRVIGTMLDVTERKAIERQLQMASKRAMLYLDLLGHDVTNQLQILRSCNALLKEKRNSAEINELLEMTDDAVSECQRIISKAKSTEHLAESPLEIRDLRHVLAYRTDAVRSIHNKAVVESDCKVDEAPILADDFLECLLDNLLENAVQHNPHQERRIWVGIQPDNDGFEMSVSDNGPGIPDRDKDKLLDLTRRFGGVGLHQVKEILEKYKGKIDVYDRVAGKPECGTEFRVWFPRATEKGQKEMMENRTDWNHE